MSPSQRTTYQIGPFRLDPADRELRRQDGEPVPLTPKAVDTLLALVEREGRLVSKEELLEAVWPGKFVEEATLTQNIYTLRKAMAAAGAEEELIETVPRRGYRLRIAVARRGAPGALPDRPPPAQPGAPALSELRTLAVLPFRVLGTTEEAEFLSVGMADALVSRLSRLRRLIVRPSGAVQRFQPATDDPVALGLRLQVDAVLEGTVQWLDERCRVTVQLVTTTDGAAVWAEHFDTAAGHPFALQDEISERTVEALDPVATVSIPLPGKGGAPSPGGAEDRRTAAAGDPPPAAATPAVAASPTSAAYREYLKGRFFWNKRTGDDLAAAIGHFRRAVELEPSFPRAHAGLADCHLLLPLYAGTPPHEAFPPAIAAAERALELDDGLAEAHASLAYAHCFYHWDWPASRAGYERAIERDPRYPTAHHWQAFLCSARGRHDGALAAVERALELDPLSLVINTDRGLLSAFARRFHDAVGHLEQTLSLQADFAYAHFALALTHHAVGDYAQALAVARRGLEITGGANSAMLAIQGAALAATGDEEGARRCLSELSAGGLPASRRAIVLTALGDHEAALAELAEAVRQRSRFALFLPQLAVFDPLRDEPGFKRLLVEAGL